MVPRTALALVVGLALGMTVVGSASYLPVNHAGGAPYLGANPSSVYNTYEPTGAGGGKPAVNGSVSDLSGTAGQAFRASQLSSLASQPAPVSALVLLPVLGGAALGLVLYRAARVREDEDRLPDS